jgi:exosortase
MNPTLQRAWDARFVHLRASRSLIPAGIVALSLIPILILFARELWARPHYQFFPFVVPAAALLAWRWCRGLEPLSPGSPTISWGLAGLAWVTLAFSVACLSPGMGAVAALLTLLAGAYGLGGWRLVRAGLPAWAMLWLAVPPPRRLDVTAIVKLQNLVSRWSSQVLDALGVLHVMDGNVVKVAGRRLLVDQACSGIYSLLTLLIGTLFYILWVRTSPARSVFLVLSSIFWVIFGNVTRIVLIAVLSTRYGIDLATGWRHEVLGLFMFALMLGLVLSTDRLISFVASSWRWLASRRQGSPQMSQAESLDLIFQGAGRPLLADSPSTGIAAPPNPSGSESDSTRVGDRDAGFLDFRRSWLGSWYTAVAFGIIFLPELFMPGVKWREVLLAADLYHGLFAPLGENAMPERFGPFQRVGFLEQSRAKDNSWGEYSKTWTYQGLGRVSMISLDYEFIDWHELTDCYRGQGWKMMSREVVVPPAKSDASREGEDAETKGPYVLAEFTHPDGRVAALFFSLFDRQGRVVEPPEVQGTISLLENRFKSWFRTGDVGGSDAECLHYQLQLFTQLESPLSGSNRETALELFREASKRVVRLGLNARRGNP